MAQNTHIEWTDATWNVVTGCVKVSPGCDNCYAETFAERWRGTPGHHFETGFDLTLRPERLGLPLRWRQPRAVFVNSMADLFHPDVPDEFIASVFAVMAATSQHTYQILTKRHGRMLSLLRDECRCGKGHGPGVHLRSAMDWAATPRNPAHVPGLTSTCHTAPWPLPNVWPGVSVETQQWAEIRIHHLGETPAALRWVSCEPLLGPLDLTPWLGVPGGVDWVVVGGESGAGARPLDPAWVRDLVDQCAGAEVPVFVKQLGTVWARQHRQPGKGGDPAAWPPGLRVRQYPRLAGRVS